MNEDISSTFSPIEYIFLEFQNFPSSGADIHVKVFYFVS
jgi:hypothetical protein